MATIDSLQRFIFENAPIRGEFIQLHATYQTIINQHPYPEPMRRLLGEALCVAGLLAAIIKFDGRLTVQFRGKGKLHLLLAQCDNNFNMRGLVKWSGGDLSYAELMAAFNEGTLVIRLDSGVNKQRYQGIVAWQGNSLAESIEGYFKHSEQLATKIWLAVDETHAAGLLLQIVPGSGQENRHLEAEIIKPSWSHITNLTNRMVATDMLSLDYQALLDKLYPEETIRVFPSDTVGFKCACSRQRGEDAIRVLGREEAEAELKDKNSIVVTCDFCNQEYLFDRIDVAKIFDGQDLPPTDIQLH